MNHGNNEIYKYFEIISKKKYLFIIMSLFVMTLFTAYGYYIPKKYQANCTVFIEDSIIDDLVKGISIETDIKSQVRVIKYALSSRDIIGKALRRINHPSVSENESTFQGLISSLQKRTKIKVKKNDLFIVSITDKDPVFAKNYINSLVETYIDENISSSLADTHGADRFLKEQLAVFKGKLDASEDAIIDFRRKRGVYFTVDEESELKEIKELLRKIEEIDLSISTANARKDRLDNQLSSVSPTVDILSQDADGNRLDELVRRLGGLRLLYTESYPEVVRLRAKIVALKQQEGGQDHISGVPTSKTTSVNPLYQKLQQQLFEVDTEISSLSARKESLGNALANKESILRNVPDNKKELAVLVQERNSYRQIYQKFLTRMGQSEVSKQIKISDKADTFRIVDSAILPTSPVSPNMIRIIFIAIMSGLGCGLASVLLVETLDTTIKNSEQLESLGLEVLACIPSIIPEAQKNRTKRLNYLFYSISSIYFSGFLGLILYEFLGSFKL